MDYKQVACVIKWHAMHSELSGAEARLIMFMATSCNHKTSKIQASYNELAEAVGLSRASVAKAIKSLEDKKAISVEIPASGRMVATYRIRTASDLNDYYLVERKNPEADRWHEKHDERFIDLKIAREEIAEGCEECSDDYTCPMHRFKIKQLEDSLEWREYMLWLADNPRPAETVKMINGKVVE